MAQSAILVTHPDNDFPTVDAGNPRRLLNDVSAWLRRVLGGYSRASGVTSRKDAVQAAGTVTFASSADAVGAIINGVTITVTWATSDANSSILFAAAVNASVNALVAGLVTAAANTPSAGITTITAVNAGKEGNQTTLVASGTNVTVSGARLTGGTNGTETIFAI